MSAAEWVLLVVSVVLCVYLGYAVMRGERF
jgi:K+-transporting ATPase KdpF subunit